MDLRDYPNLCISTLLVGILYMVFRLKEMREFLTKRIHLQLRICVGGIQMQQK